MGATANWTKVYDGDDKARAGDAGLIKKVYSFTCSASYATGGDTVAPATDFALGTSDTVISSNIIEQAGALSYVARYDAVNNKVLLYSKDTGAEVAATTDVSTADLRAEFLIQRG